MTTRMKWNNVIILSIAQALFLTSIILMMTLSGMVGLKLSTNKSLATLPVAMIAVGTALMLIPPSMIIKKVGQRNAIPLLFFFLLWFILLVKKRYKKGN